MSSDCEYDKILSCVALALSDDKRAAPSIEVAKEDRYLCQTRIYTGCENLVALRARLGTEFLQMMGQYGYTEQISVQSVATTRFSHPVYTRVPLLSLPVFLSAMGCAVLRPDNLSYIVRLFGGRHRVSCTPDICTLQPTLLKCMSF